MVFPAVEFEGTARFRVLRRLGEGGMGVVYEAEDCERGARVALKTFRHADSDTIYRLKREFRSLVELSHPNLAALYDLVVEEERCFFTMELVDGCDFLMWVAPPLPDEPRPRVASPLAYAETQTTQESPSIDPFEPRNTPSSPTGPSAAPWTPQAPRALACDERRLRAALPQLGLGLTALHAAGKIHRDIKPSNIRVTDDGRVVLLDFGLVADLHETPLLPADPEGIVGTVAYMAPEQAAGERRLSPAADWYATGVLLYQALTGRLPFEGPPLRVLADKQQHAPPPPRTLVPDVATDLDELCASLLARDPRERPAGPEVLRRLGIDLEQRGLRPTTSISRETPLAGRDAELGALREALRTVERGRPAAVLVRGPSGIGKSTLVARFLEQARARHPALLVLAGRCYEREAVPYRAMDGLIDHLSNYWSQLPSAEARELCPPDAGVLARLFPVLGRVPAVADSSLPPATPDAQELRTRAFAALRAMLIRLSEKRPLVLFLDDLQWVDGDTAALLADIMRAPDPPRLLLLLSTRVEGSEAVAALLERLHAARRTIDLGPLAEDDAVALAARHLGDEGEGEELARRIAREAHGSPFFLLELVRHMQGRDPAELGRLRLDEVLGRRIDQLADEARAVAEVVAIAGEPITLAIAGTAAGVGAESLRRQLQHLRAERFVRVAGGRADDQLEPYHDRVREALLAHTPEERKRRHHRLLATALGHGAPPERLARHWAGAGEHARAAEQARRAAQEAQATLDFERAAGFYRMALELGSFGDSDRRGLRVALATALGDAGRPIEAAREFAAAAADAGAAEALELRRRAADALLRGGYVDEGLDATRRVLAHFGLDLQPTPRRALAALLWRRARLRLRGLGWRPRALADIAQNELTRVDVLEDVAMGLSMVDSFRSADFSTRFILAALDLGEPRRVGKALALEADLQAALGNAARARRLAAELERLTGEDATPQARAQLMTTQGMLAFLADNRFREALRLLEEATALYKAHERRAGFEINIVAQFICWARQYLGELDELARRVPAMVEAAKRSGDRFAMVNLRTAFPVVWLLDDQPEAGERDVEEALATWAAPGGPYQMQHFFAMISQCDLALYRGDAEAATARLARDRAAMRAAMLDRLPANQLLLTNATSRAELACAARAPAGSSARREHMRRAERACQTLVRRGAPVAVPFSQMISGICASLGGDDTRAVALLREALVGLDAVEMNLFATAVRWHLGALLGGDEGAAFTARARAWADSQHVKRPDRLMHMLAPRLPEPSP